MHILVTGATGLVGKELVHRLIERGHEVSILTRNPDKAKAKFNVPINAFKWDAKNELPPKESVENIDGVINLLGENIAAKRWSDKQKKEIIDSREKTTQNLVKQINDTRETPLSFFISASAVGYYARNNGDRKYPESSQAGEGFLAQTCLRWENACDGVNAQRKVIQRIGVVLARDGGALEKLFPIFQLGAGGKVGDGQQYMSWIHLDDLVDLLIYSAEKDLNGAFNAVSPGVVTNKEFTQAFARNLNRPAIFPVPAFMLKILLGEMSSIILDSQFVVPEATFDSGFKFRFEDIDLAMKDLCSKDQYPSKKKEISCDHFEGKVWLPNKREEVFAFFQEAKNLESMTPPWVKFKILRQSTTDIQKDTVFDYKIKVHSLPLKWRTRIIKWAPPEVFSDNQEKGPYALWYHTHKFVECRGGTMMTDTVKYKVPLGILGYIFIRPFVKSDVEKIFAYRTKVIKEKFN